MVRRAIKFNTIDTVTALTVAFFVNAAILVLAAIVFNGKDSVTMPDGQVVAFNADTDWIRAAYLTLAPLLGTTAASTLFAVALLASGQSSTITGTLAGQVVMEGFMHWRIRPWVRRLITRMPRHPPGHPHHRPARGTEQRDRPADAQPGGAGHAAPPGHVPAHALYQLQKVHGQVRQRLVPAYHRVGDLPAHHRPGPLRPAGLRFRMRGRSSSAGNGRRGRSPLKNLSLPLATK